MPTETVKPNSLPRGSRDLWPVLLMAVMLPAPPAKEGQPVPPPALYERPAAKVERLNVGRPAEVETAKARELGAEIEAGDHDAYLFELLSLEFGHGHRDAVISAVQARAKKLKLEGCPTDPRVS